MNEQTSLRYSGVLNLSRRALLSMLLTASVWGQATLADYRDPLDLPALKMDSASQSLLLDIAEVNGRLVAVGERGHILYSDRRNGQWQQSEVPVRAQLNAVFFIDEKRGWAVGEDAAIVHTVDGGLTWQKQFDARNAEIQGPLLDVYFKDASVGFAVGVFNKLYRTEDGGETWEDWSDHADNPQEWHFFTIAATDPDTLYLSSETGLIFRSQNGGKTFEPIQTQHNGSFQNILAKRTADGGDWLIASGVGGQVFTSKDGGDNWKELNTGTEAGLAGGTWLADGSAVIVGANGVMVHVAPGLNSVNKYQVNSGLPLSDVVRLAEGPYLMVGLGGIHSIDHVPAK